MRKPTLVVMAAGIGSRYGGLKQIEPMGPNGELIIEYSIYDAIKAGFGKVVFIIKKEMIQSVKKIIANKLEDFIDIEYVFQDINNVPEGFSVPRYRVKPWGTGHAILCCREVISTPFAVINADDFYGRETYNIMAKFLKNNKKSNLYAMAGFILERTLTEAGTVARGICLVDNDNNLISVKERTKIKKIDGSIKYTENLVDWINIPNKSMVSMNLWGFTPEIFKELEIGFKNFLNSIEYDDNKKRDSEYYLPKTVNDILQNGEGIVKVLKTNEQWYGVTYIEDKENVKNALRKLEGIKYPDRLWEEFKKDAQ